MRKGISVTVCSILLGVLFLMPVLTTTAEAAALDAWQGATSMEELVADGLPSDPVIAATDHGLAVAAWVWNYNGVDHVRAAYYDPTSGWSSPVVLDENGDAGSPRAAIDQYGDAVVSWIEEEGGAQYIAACVWTIDGGWERTERITTVGASAISSLNVLNDLPGHFIIIASAVNSTGRFIELINYGSRTGFDAFPSSLYQSINDIVSVSSSTNGQGEAWLAWEEGGSQSVVRSLNMTNGTWSPSPRTVVTTGSAPVVAAGPENNAILAYVTNRGPLTAVMGTAFQEEEWAAPVELLNVTGSVNQLRLSADSQGRGVLAALAADAAAARVYGASFNGTIWSQGVNVANSTAAIASLAMAQDVEGRAKIVYVVEPPLPSEHYALYQVDRYVNGTWGGPEAIEGMGGGSPYQYFDLASSGVDYWLLFARYEFGVQGEYRLWVDKFEGAATGPALLTVDSTLLNSTVNIPSVEIKGTAEPGSVVMIGGLSVQVDKFGNFSVILPLQEGPNLITLTTTDSQGRYASEQITVTYGTSPAETAGLLAVLLGAIAILVCLSIMVLFLRYKRTKE